MPRSLVRAPLEAAVDIGMLQLALRRSAFLWEHCRLRRCYFLSWRGKSQTRSSPSAWADSISSISTAAPVSNLFMSAPP
jgi:hypothetical protein